MKCHDYKIGNDTAGKPILGRRCYCGTTVCLKNQIQNYAEVERVEFKRLDELTSEEEERFYKKVFSPTQ